MNFACVSVVLSTETQDSEQYLYIFIANDIILLFLPENRFYGSHVMKKEFKEAL